MATLIALYRVRSKKKGITKTNIKLLLFLIIFLALPGTISSPAAFNSVQKTSIHFSDITNSSGTSGYSEDGYGHGLSFADVNRDGYIDLLVSNAVRELVLPDVLYMNTGGNVFSEEALARGVADAGLTHSIVAADINNDGDLDAFYSNMSVYEDKHLGYGRNALYQNNGDGTFSDITDWATIADELNDSRGAIALDINNDGWLDLFAVTWGGRNEMYLNDGTGRMRRVSRGADGPEGDTSEKQGVTAADFDKDGDIDIYVCRREAPNCLFVNDGGFFSEQADFYNIDVGGRSHGATFADIDNDADLDLFVVNYTPSGSSTPPPLYVFQNQGDGTFLDMTDAVDLTISGYSVSFGDVDNDADLDMLLLYNDCKQPNARPRLYLNNGSGLFELVDNAGVEVPAVDARAAAFADIDNDGDLDLYITCKAGQNFLLRNDLNNGNHSIDVLCFGPLGDFGGFGAKVTVYEAGHVGDENFILGYQESVSNYAYLCQNQTALHFGLGPFTQCDIRFEHSNGQVHDFVDVAADQSIDLPEEWCTVTSPNGGEEWDIGSLQSICWYSRGSSGTVNVELSTNAGSTWSVITEGTPNDGLFEWTVPNNPSDLCLIRVSDTDGSPSDASDAEFSITPAGIIGDVNDDTQPNSTDALIILSCDVGLDVSAFCPMNCGDVNFDGTINSTDALIILSYDVGIEISFPVGESGCHENVTPCLGCTP
ncbi:VCBS repeat-containing protein [candidate division KSB1 bacterium]|nr:VCBS repeat-containing protein [candidate division KSB1 bacterium]